MIVPVLVIVERKVTVPVTEATKGYMTAIVSRLKQLCICLLLSVSCYIVLSESIKSKLPPVFLLNSPGRMYIQYWKSGMLEQARRKN